MFLKKVEAMISQETIYVVVTKPDLSIEMAFAKEADAEKFIGKEIRKYAIISVPFIKRYDLKKD